MLPDMPYPVVGKSDTFQWAPTLGGECYDRTAPQGAEGSGVSMGTHPWG